MIKGARRNFKSRSAKKVERLEMFMRSQQKSTHQAAHESRLTRHTILSILHKELNYSSCNSHYVQQLQPADCDHNMEYGELMLGWHGVCDKL